MARSDLADHVVVVTSSPDQCANGVRRLEPLGARASFIITESARESVPVNALGVELVGATTDVAAVRSALSALIDRHGPPTGVIALGEDELVVAALLREDHGCPGPPSADVRRLHDRVESYRTVAAAGLAVPAFVETDDPQQVAELGRRVGWPLVVRCRAGGAAGVLINDPTELADLDALGGPLMARARNENPVFHVDGFATGQGEGRWWVSRFLDHGPFPRSRVASVEVDDVALAGAVAEHAMRYLSALTNEPVPFHIEMFVDLTGGTVNSCELAEIRTVLGDDPVSREIESASRELRSCDLLDAAVRWQLGLPVAEPDPTPAGADTEKVVGGWLLVPAPAGRPCRITAVTSMVGRDPHLYAESVLPPGTVLPDGGASVEPAGGRFRFRGTSTAEVTEAITATATEFRIGTEQLGSNGVAGGRDYSRAVLPGFGDTDYARYMQIDALLSLQRRPEEVIHRDELLFQTVHQSTELWLKHACFEANEAAERLRDKDLEASARLLARGSLGVELVTEQLEMMRHLSPWTFQTIRTVLGNGSGFESPGWRGVQAVSKRLRKHFLELLDLWDVRLVDIYRGSADASLYRLAEALIEWDERIALWRTRHYKVATRVIGHQVVGTKGTEVDTLARLIGHKFFPELWSVRTELTETGPMAETNGAAPATTAGGLS